MHLSRICHCKCKRKSNSAFSLVFICLFQPLVQQLKPNSEDVNVDIHFEDGQLTIQRNDTSKILFRVRLIKYVISKFDVRIRLATTLLSIYKPVFSKQFFNHSG